MPSDLKLTADNLIIKISENDSFGEEDGNLSYLPMSFIDGDLQMFKDAIIIGHASYFSEVWRKL